MRSGLNKVSMLLVVSALVMSACATGQNYVSQPKVSLDAVELSKIRLNSQSFLLSMSVSNPNAFPLPIESVRYRILFDGQTFASGNTPAGFSIPANGDGAFTLSVETDFLKSAGQITSLLSGGVPEHVEYELQGSLKLDIPLVQPVSFSSSGVIPINNNSF